jgi:hypothetical protein
VVDPERAIIGRHQVTPSVLAISIGFRRDVTKKLTLIGLRVSARNS